MSNPILECTARELDSLSPRTIEDVRALSDAELVELQRLDAQFVQRAQTRSAVSAGEIARRSHPSLGSDGLAQRTGFRTPVELVRVTTGSTKRDASSAVRVGSLAQDPHPVSDALLDGQISVAAADAIRNGLGTPTAEITEQILADAAAALCEEAPTLDPDRLFLRARQLRDAIDEDGIADREAARHALRSLRISKTPDGMTRLNWLMDPETAAVVSDVYDRATSPRRGGPRFVDGPQADLAAAITGDERTTEQLASDVFAEVLRHGVDADSSRLLGSGAPVVRIVVTKESLDSGRGAAWIEGQSEPISIATVERAKCSGGVQEAWFDENGQALDLGLEQRLFSKKQKLALALRDGGCMWDDCDRPASWTEAHHVVFYKQNGPTNIANGILLCRYHHLLLHNNGWQILMDDNAYWLIPPKSIDAQQRRRRLRPKGGWWRTG